MSLTLYVKDTETGKVHEYGKCPSRADALVITPDGTLKYKRIDGSPDGQYVFVASEEGESVFDLDIYKTGILREPFIDVGGDPQIDCTICKHFEDKKKCDDCLYKKGRKPYYEAKGDAITLRDMFFKMYLDNYVFDPDKKEKLK